MIFFHISSFNLDLTFQFCGHSFLCFPEAYYLLINQINNHIWQNKLHEIHMGRPHQGPFLEGCNKEPVGKERNKQKTANKPGERKTD